MSDRRLLIAVAHPDDEAFGYGGLITKYVRAGIDVYLIVSTNGDVGTVAPEYLNGYKSVAELRLAELDCASEKLGFKKVFKLGYKDSGMMGSETSKDPACSWQAPREELARKVVEVIREVRPQVILTFNKYGGYGHPDHIAIQRATTDAFTLAGDASYITQGLAPYQPQKLYYSSMPTLMMRWNILRVRLKGQNPRKLGRNQDIDIVKILENIEPAHAMVDVRAYMKEWDEASACHASQLGGGSMPQMPEWLRRRLRGLQRFTRVYPVPYANRVDERDLFDGVRVDELLSVS